MALTRLSPRSTSARTASGCQIGRVEEIDGRARSIRSTAVREVVRLGAGLTAEKRIDRARRPRALEALAKFGERLARLSAAGGARGRAPTRCASRRTRRSSCGRRARRSASRSR